MTVSSGTSSWGLPTSNVLMVHAVGEASNRSRYIFSNCSSRPAGSSRPVNSCKRACAFKNVDRRLLVSSFAAPASEKPSQDGVGEATVQRYRLHQHVASPVGEVLLKVAANLHPALLHYALEVNALD